jgi:hypothetical protein
VLLPIQLIFNPKDPANNNIKIKSQFDVCGAAIKTQFETGGLVVSIFHPDNLSKFSHDHLVISTHYPSMGRGK